MVGKVLEADRRTRNQGENIFTGVEDTGLQFTSSFRNFLVEPPLGTCTALTVILHFLAMIDPIPVVDPILMLDPILLVGPIPMVDLILMVDPIPMVYSIPMAYPIVNSSWTLYS